MLNREEPNRNSVSISEKCVVYWDYENCPIPFSVKVNAIKKHIESKICESLNRDKLPIDIKCYLPPPNNHHVHVSRKTKEEMQHCGIEIYQIPSLKREAVDKRIIADIALDLYEWKGKSINSIALISGDKDYSYLLSKIKNKPEIKKSFLFIFEHSQEVNNNLRHSVDKCFKGLPASLYQTYDQFGNRNRYRNQSRYNPRRRPYYHHPNEYRDRDRSRTRQNRRNYRHSHPPNLQNDEQKNDDNSEESRSSMNQHNPRQSYPESFQREGIPSSRIRNNTETVSPRQSVNRDSSAVSLHRIDKPVFSIISRSTGVFDELQFVKSDLILLLHDGFTPHHKFGQVAVYYNAFKGTGKLIFAESRDTLTFRERIKNGCFHRAEWDRPQYVPSGSYVVAVRKMDETKYSFNFCNDRATACQFMEAFNAILVVSR